MKTKQLITISHVAQVREVSPVISGEKKPDGTVVHALGPKQYEIVVGPPVNLTWIVASDLAIKKGYTARVILEVDIP